MAEEREREGLRVADEGRVALTVHGVVHEDEPASTGCPIVIAGERRRGDGRRKASVFLPVPGVDQDGGVVKPVQKDQLLLA